jgi:hypothetical protein
LSLSLPHAHTKGQLARREVKREARQPSRSSGAPAVGRETKVAPLNIRRTPTHGVVEAETAGCSSSGQAQPGMIRTVSSGASSAWRGDVYIAGIHVRCPPRLYA